MSNKKSEASAFPFRLEVTGGFLLLLSLSDFFCGAPTLLTAALAVTVHELGHLTALLTEGKIPSAIRLDAAGACIRCTPAESPGAEAVRALSGPAAGLLLWLLLLSDPSPLLGLTRSASLTLSLVNLLPVRALDGGRALSALTRWRASRRTDFLLGLSVLLLGGLCHSTLCWYGLWITIRSILNPPD